MHTIEPHYAWHKYYIAAEDERSPFFGKEYNELYFEHDIYGFYIHPQWEYIGSETLYLKLLYTDYETGTCILELFGEWNDTLHNDIMHLKRNLIDELINRKINKFILIGENLFNFHGCEEDDYYAEWFDEVEDGWIVTMLFRNHVIDEWRKFGLDQFFNFGGMLEMSNWRTFNPKALCSLVSSLVSRRLVE